MASVRPSAFNQREHPHGGPFLILEDTEGKAGKTKTVYFTDTPPELRGDSYPIARLMQVHEKALSIWPLNVRADRDDYLSSKYGVLEQILITPYINSSGFKLPENTDDVIGLLEDLPDGFSKDFKFGLGLLWEYRSICETIAEAEIASVMIVHGGSEVQIEPPYFKLPIRKFNAIRKEINRVSARQQREGRRDKKHLTYDMLLHEADKTRYPPLKKTLRRDLIADATRGGFEAVNISKRDRRAVVNIVRDNMAEIAASEPQALLNLKAQIEDITLAQLIERYRQMLAANLTEQKWQTFFTQNPFILSLMFSIPAMLVQGQAYAGGKRLNDRGGKVMDFLYSTATTGNLAIVEIKTPGTKLLSNTSFRGDDVFPTSNDLNNTIAQVLDQRFQLKRNLPNLRDDTEKHDIFDYSIRCIVVVGTTPVERKQKKSFELMRSALHDVTVVTFDEVLYRLEMISEALKPPEIAIPF